MKYLKMIPFLVLSCAAVKDDSVGKEVGAIGFVKSTVSGLEERINGIGLGPLSVPLTFIAFSEGAFLLQKGLITKERYLYDVTLLCSLIPPMVFVISSILNRSVAAGGATSSSVWSMLMLDTIYRFTVDSDLIHHLF